MKFAVLTIVALGLLIGASAVLVIGFITNPQRVFNLGIVHTGEGITVDRSTIDWGYMKPNDTLRETLNVTNTLNTTMTLDISITDFLPSNADTYLNVTWNYTGEPLPAYSSILVEFTLSVSDPAPETNFEFIINIIGSDE